MDLSKGDSVLEVAINAVALTTKGRTTSDSTLIRESTRLYAFALSEVNRALQDPVKARSDEILACCKVLSMFESFRAKETPGISTQGNSWHNHIDGTCGLVELRGPDRHKEGHGHALFADLRIVAVRSGLTRRRATVSTSTVRHQTPWETTPKTLLDDLVDLMLVLPDILARQDALLVQLAVSETTSEQDAACTVGQDLIVRCIHLGESLNGWEQNVLRAVGEASGMPQIDSSPSLQDVCKNHGYGLFDAIMQYWTICMTLYMTTKIIHRSMTNTAQPLSRQPPDVPNWMSPHPMADRIAENAHHYFDEDAGYWGAASAAFPLGAVSHFCAATGTRESPCGREVARLMNATTLGRMTKDFLQSIANTINSVRGDTTDPQQHKSMATSWYRIGQ